MDKQELRRAIGVELGYRVEWAGIMHWDLYRPDGSLKDWFLTENSAWIAAGRWVDKAEQAVHLTKTDGWGMYGVYWIPEKKLWNCVLYFMPSVYGQGPTIAMAICEAWLTKRKEERGKSNEQA